MEITPGSPFPLVVVTFGVVLLFGVLAGLLDRYVIALRFTIPFIILCLFLLLNPQINSTGAPSAVFSDGVWYTTSSSEDADSFTVALELRNPGGRARRIRLREGCGILIIIPSPVYGSGRVTDPGLWDERRIGCRGESRSYRVTGTSPLVLRRRVAKRSVSGDSITAGSYSVFLLVNRPRRALFMKIDASINLP